MNTRAAIQNHGLHSTPDRFNLSVLSYNIHKGFSTGGTRFVLQEIRSMIRSTEADIVFLQEVIGNHSGHAETISNWPSEPQFEYLADSIWPHQAYGKNAVYSDGHHGNAILSKHNIISWDNIDVSSHPFENRGLLHAVIRPANFNRDIHVICLHLALLEFGRTQQIRRLCERVNEQIPPDAPLIIAGDFNDWRHSAGLMLEKFLGVAECHKTLTGRYARTFPSIFPLLHLDRIYARGLQPAIARALKDHPWSNLSDHVPLYCRLEGVNTGESAT